MKAERLGREGFTLPLVLLFLLVGTLTGILATSLATTQSRFSGQLGFSLRALQAAESGAAFLVNGLASGSIPWPGNGSFAGEDLSALAVGLPGERPALPNHGPVRWWAESLLVDGDSAVIRVVGEAPGAANRRALEVLFVRSEGGLEFPFGTAVMGCNGVNLQGSGRIDSYDSRSGPYNAGSAGSNASVSTLNGNLNMPGNTRIRGDVHISGNLTQSGSSTIEGAYSVAGDVNFNGNPTCPAAPVNASGSINTPGGWWCPAAQLNPGAPVPPAAGVCDPLGVDDFVLGQLDAARPSNPAQYQGGNYSGWNPNPIVFTDNVDFSPNLSAGSTTVVEFDTETMDQVFVNGNVSAAGSSRIRIKAPTTPGVNGKLKLFIAGDLTLTGAAQLIIEPGAALEVYVTGRVNLGGGLVNQNSSPTITIIQDGVPVSVPSFAIFSSFDGANGIQVGGNSQIFASIYAPRTDIQVAGSGGLYGSVRGRSITVTGAGGIHFDEALASAQVGTSSESGASRVARWVEVAGG